MKIFLNKINEDWIIDRLSLDFKNKYKQNTTNFIIFSDIIWIIAPWTWKKIPIKYLKSKKVLCSYYHFDFSSFDYDDFNNLDQYVDEYHVISEKTRNDLINLTDKKITSIPFWVDEKIFFNISDKEKLIDKRGLNYYNNKMNIMNSLFSDSDDKIPDIIKKFIRKCNLSVRLTDFNIDKEHLTELINNVNMQRLSNNPLAIDKKQILKRQ